MRNSSRPNGRCSRYIWWRSSVVGVCIISLAACAAPSQYMGIRLAGGRADPELQQLANRARAGDKQAQLELGIAFEEGRCVRRDRKRAERLYAAAAADVGGRIWIFSPPVRKGASGRTVPVDQAPAQRGLEEAVRRLDALRNEQTRP